MFILKYKQDAWKHIVILCNCSEATMELQTAEEEAKMATEEARKAKKRATEAPWCWLWLYDADCGYMILTL